jgi:small subunit ribosomal protein S8
LAGRLDASDAGESAASSEGMACISADNALERLHQNLDSRNIREVIDMLHDPLNDVLVKIKNAEKSGKKECQVKASKLIGNVLKVMMEHNYVTQFEFVDDGKSGLFNVKLSGTINSCGVIKPRFSVKARDIERYESRYLPGQDFGILILTTTAGVISNAKAKELGIGGKLLAYVY